MILVVAGNYTDFKDWVRNNVRYVSRPDKLYSFNPSTTQLFVTSNASNNEDLYFSDELLTALIAQASYSGNTKSRLQTLKESLHWQTLKELIKRDG